jgi:hypothetical protein
MPKKRTRTTTVVDRLAHIFGSQAEVARICGVDKSSVVYWNAVPVKHHRRLLDEAKTRRKRLTHADLVA